MRKREEVKKRFRTTSVRRVLTVNIILLDTSGACTRETNFYVRNAKKHSHEITTKSVTNRNVPRKDIPCSKCHKTLCKQSYRKQHESRCTGTKVFSCSEYHLTFPTVFHLNFHSRLKHGIKQADIRKRKRETETSTNQLGHTHQPTPPRKRQRKQIRDSQEAGPSSYRCH